MQPLGIPEANNQKYLGAYFADRMPTLFQLHPTQAQGKSGKWHQARPTPYCSLLVRLRQAWDVLTYKADTLYWNIDIDK